MQGHVLIADWSVAYFVVIMNDVMNNNIAAFAHVGARLGAFFYWTRFLDITLISTKLSKQLCYLSELLSLRVISRLMISTLSLICSSFQSLLCSFLLLTSLLSYIVKVRKIFICNVVMCNVYSVVIIIVI